MHPQRWHVTGASGVGTTTLGRALAGERSIPHADADDFYWVPTDPPFTTKRPPEERVALMEEVFVPRPSWVLSGSVMGWGEALVERFDAVIFLSLDAEERLARLRAREHRRYGARIEPGGDLEQACAEFLTWASGYDDPTFDGRNLASHERWLASLPCPVLRLSGARPTADLVAEVEAWADRS